MPTERRFWDIQSTIEPIPFQEPSNVVRDMVRQHLEARVEDIIRVTTSQLPTPETTPLTEESLTRMWHEVTNSDSAGARAQMRGSLLRPATRPPPIEYDVSRTTRRLRVPPMLRGPEIYTGPEPEDL